MRITITFGPDVELAMVDGVAPTGVEPALVGGPDGVPLAVGADGVQAIKTIESTPTKEIARPRIGPMVSPPRLAFHLLDVEMMRTVPADTYADAADRWRRFGVVPDQAFAFLGQGRCLVELSRPTEATPVLLQTREFFERLRVLKPDDLVGVGHRDQLRRRDHPLPRLTSL